MLIFLQIPLSTPEIYVLSRSHPQPQVNFLSVQKISKHKNNLRKLALKEREWHETDFATNFCIHATTTAFDDKNDQTEANRTGRG